MCCTWYYLNDTKSLGLPANKIDPDAIFWNGSSSVNGFYTNFTSSYVKMNLGNCNVAWVETTRPVGFSIDMNGEWCMTDDYAHQRL